MKKIPTIFKRNPDNIREVLNEVNPGCEWVFDGRGIPTVKFDGTACLVRDHKLYKRYDCKKGKTPPDGFEPCQDPDPITGHWPGWVPIDDYGPEDKWFREAYPSPKELPDGTYELIGPKINGNPHKRTEHILVPHGDLIFMGVIPTYEALKTFLTKNEKEGIVWHHPDGHMAKIKARDFGIKWPR